MPLLEERGAKLARRSGGIQADDRVVAGEASEDEALHEAKHGDEVGALFEPNDVAHETIVGAGDVEARQVDVEVGLVDPAGDPFTEGACGVAAGAIGELVHQVEEGRALAAVEEKAHAPAVLPEELEESRLFDEATLEVGGEI